MKRTRTRALISAITCAALVSTGTYVAYAQDDTAPAQGENTNDGESGEDTPSTEVNDDLLIDEDLTDEEKAEELRSIRNEVDEGISPPVNPLPSYYEINKIDYPGSTDPGIAPPVNPFPYSLDD